MFSHTSCFCSVNRSCPFPPPSLPLVSPFPCRTFMVALFGVFTVHGHGALLFDSLLWLHPGHRVSHSSRQHSNSQTVVCMAMWAQSGGHSRAVEHSALLNGAKCIAPTATFCGGGGGWEFTLVHTVYTREVNLAGIHSNSAMLCISCAVGGCTNYSVTRDWLLPSYLVLSSAVDCSLILCFGCNICIPGTWKTDRNAHALLWRIDMVCVTSKYDVDLDW